MDSAPPALTSAPCSRPPALPPQVQAPDAPMETTPTLLPPATRPRLPSTAEQIFRDYTFRRVALIRALTKDEKLFSCWCRCNPGTESQYLYGNTDGSWEVRPPKFPMQSGLPDPMTLGINIARDNMKPQEWLRHIAMHCDTWLHSIVAFLGADLTDKARQRLNNMIGGLQTVHKTFISHLEKMNNEIENEDEGCGAHPTFCGNCGDRYHANASWIRCNVCERWYHCRCVKLTAHQAKDIKKYRCPECSRKKRGHN